MKRLRFLLTLLGVCTCMNCAVKVEPDAADPAACLAAFRTLLKEVQGTKRASDPRAATLRDREAKAANKVAAGRDAAETFARSEKFEAIFRHDRNLGDEIAVQCVTNETIEALRRVAG